MSIAEHHGLIYFFSSNVHIVGFSLDYSEIDIWWLLNKRARFAVDGLVKNEIYFYADGMSEEKIGLLHSFKVKVIISEVISNNYKEMYKSAIKKLSSTDKIAL